MNKVTGAEFWQSVAEMYYKSIVNSYDSLCELDKNYLSIDMSSLLLCSDMLRNYTDKLECKKGVTPEIPHEIQVVMSLLDKLTKDMNIIRDIVTDNIKTLYTE